MAQVTSPIILDSTGQQIHSDLQQIKSILTTPSTAADISFDNTGTGMQADDVQDAITELKSNLTDLIKTKSYNATTTDTGVIAVTDLTANNIIPIQVTTSINNCYHIFGTNSSGKLAIRFTDSGGASKASTTISGTVYYIEI